MDLHTRTTEPAVVLTPPAGALDVEALVERAAGLRPAEVAVTAPSALGTLPAVATPSPATPSPATPFAQPATATPATAATPAAPPATVKPTVPATPATPNTSAAPPPAAPSTNAPPPTAHSGTATPAGLVVFDLRRVTALTPDAAAPLIALAAAPGPTRHVALAEPGGAVHRALAAADPAGVLARFATLDEVLLGTDADRRVEELVPRFEALTRSLLSATTVAEALQQISTAARHLIEPAEVVSVTLRAPDGTFTTPAETDEVATELDQVQYRSSRGPCVDAADPDGPGYAISADLVTEERWPEFAATAVANGLTGALATQLPSPNEAVDGALNVFTKHSDGLSDTDRHVALLLATHAALALAHVRATELASLHTAQMRRAIDSRDIIGQAKGILMNRQGIGADEAFTLLRETSQHLNVKLVEVASTLVARRGELDPPTGA
ncbi:ANTAR domain-containing protein [Lentzea sp. NPDC003310]|uniref:ANTAR domain-containing protein n=1 Tax=Lentzea sp. NPDC003310 TaxID=3154447 RepID=UPI0033B7B677